MSDDPTHVIFRARSVEERELPSGTRQMTATLVGTAPSIAMKDKIFDRLMKDGVKVYVSETLKDQVMLVMKEELEKERQRVVELESEMAFLKREVSALQEDSRALHLLEEELGNLTRLTVNGVVR